MDNATFIIVRAERESCIRLGIYDSLKLLGLFDPIVHYIWSPRPVPYPYLAAHDYTFGFRCFCNSAASETLPVIIGLGSGLGW